MLSLRLTSSSFSSSPLLRRARYATAVSGTPQTLIEKIVQKYAVGQDEGKKVRSGDYVMVGPEHV